MIFYTVNGSYNSLVSFAPFWPVYYRFYSTANSSMTVTIVFFVNDYSEYNCTRILQYSEYKRKVKPWDSDLSFEKITQATSSSEKQLSYYEGYADKDVYRISPSNGREPNPVDTKAWDFVERAVCSLEMWRGDNTSITRGIDSSCSFAVQINATPKTRLTEIWNATLPNPDKGSMGTQTRYRNDGHGEYPSFYS